MPGWKAAFILFFGIVCLALAFGTMLIPMVLTDEQNKWAWFGGFLAGTILISSLFALFLRAADRAFMAGMKKGR